MAAMAALRRSILRFRRRPPVYAAALTILTAAASVAAQSDAPGASPDRRLGVEPPVVSARLFYHGETVRVDGTAPAGQEIAFVISGKNTSVDLELKGKVGGLIWANTGAVTIENVPSLYLLATSPGLRDLLEANAIESTSVGYRTIESQSRFSPATSVDEAHRIFEEFVKVKEKEQLYGVAEGRVTLTEGGGAGYRDCSAEFFIPADVPVGTFDVYLLGFDHNRETVLASASLTVEQAGLAAAISAMARERGLLYGVLSVIVALLAGLLAGIVFGHSSKGGH
jgi:uncharacterized protein (TIGR02186 family)